MTLFLAAATAAMLSLVSGSVQMARGGYVAAPLHMPAKARIIAGTILWQCGRNACHAPQSDARHAVQCQRLAREVGTLAAFQADGRPFDAEALAKCNAKAR